MKAKNYEKGDQSSLHSRNIARIMEELRQNGRLSRPELAERTNLDKRTVLNIVNKLLEKGMIRVVSRQADGAGRPKEIIGLNGDYGRYAGIDLGGTHLSGVIVNFTGQKITSQTIEVHNGMEPDTLIKLCNYLMGTLLKEAAFQEYDLNGIGISFPGFVASYRGLVTSENYPKWHDIPIQEIF
ncbi:MAG: ROK family transcriptional regulator, partial [Treponema sp.]|nr:ROK family transcriptional regulator [Treponema sp.]